MGNYPGNKNIPGVYQKIINEIPFHNNYYELFCGGASIAKLLYDPISSVVKYNLNDIDKSVCTILKTKISTLDLNNNISITSKNYLDIMQSDLSLAGVDTFVFMDPPYLHETRKNNINLYKYEMNESDHMQLLLSSLQLKCNLMIIHPVCNLYDEVLKGWRKKILKIRYHNKTSIECLYMNYEKPNILQSDLYLGSNRTDRQRIKRKANRFISKLSTLPEQERNYILNQIRIQLMTTPAGPCR